MYRSVVTDVSCVLSGLVPSAFVEALTTPQCTLSTFNRVSPFLSLSCSRSPCHLSLFARFLSLIFLYAVFFSRSLSSSFLPSLRLSSSSFFSTLSLRLSSSRFLTLPLISPLFLSPPFSFSSLLTFPNMYTHRHPTGAYPRLPPGLTRGSVTGYFESQYPFDIHCNTSQWVGPRNAHFPVDPDMPSGPEYVQMMS